jgi:IS4 transposase
MQHNKNTNKISDLEIVLSDPKKLTSSLTDAMEKFNVKRNFHIFDFIKSKGLAVSSLLSILLMLPFYSVANVYSLIKCGLGGQDFEGKKDAYYDIKNNEFIDWRKLLMLHAKRFMYLIRKNLPDSANGLTALIFDDTLLEKTGKKIEKVSIVNDHASKTGKRFVIGFKLLVCGFWDGASFIPIDFSIHRERGQKHLDFIKTYNNANKAFQKTCKLIEKQQDSLNTKKESLLQAEAKLKQLPNKANLIKCEKCEAIVKKEEEKLNDDHQIQSSNKVNLEEAKRKLKKFYNKGRLFGLTTKERQEQYKKVVSVKCEGFKRRKEADKDKISILVEMLCRAVRHGILPNYVLLDSWFFCYEILDKITKLKKGAIKLVTMVKINNQLFTVCESGKEISVAAIAKINEKRAQKCAKLKAQYIKVKCFYKGIRVNLFYVRMGCCKTWKLVLTTDLEISFIKLMEVYQIRWSIEIFFKESKQYLCLGACQSTNFDAQIADTTISLMQHIILNYFKRQNYQQSLGGLFKGLKNEIVEIDLVSRIIKVFWELIEILYTSNGIDLLALQEDIFRNNDFMVKILKLLPEKLIDKAA